MIVLSGIAIQDKIYESSNSLVYRGIRGDGSAIIVKMLKQDYPSPQELTRYRQEYEITRSLNLEGVVKAYSQQDYQRTLVILLEDFGGKSLEQWMRQRSDFCPMPVSTFLRLAIKLTDILGKIHAAHVIHKDINPGNIVLNLETGVVKIIDFGIATQFNRTNLTFKSPHVLEGTLAYLSPEQTGRMNRSLDYRTDFYSLGVTFYELLTGHLPFPATDMLELVHCHIAKQPVPPREMNIAIPKPISDLILKLMAKNAEDRYQSAWGIKADLERCAHQLEASDRIDSFQLGLHDVSNQFQIPQKLYGREAETATLLAAFERVVGGDTVAWGREVEESDNISTSSEMMLVSGYAGIGKSALVQELYKPITAKRGYFISGKFDQFQRNIPYSAIVDALRKLVQQLLSEPDEQLEQWRSRLLSALGNNGQIIIDVIPEVELIIGKQLPVPEVGVTEAQNRFNLTFQKFVRVFCSKEHPLIIFLDDLQWIDSATLKLVELILLDEQIQHLFLIGAYRDNEVSPTHPLVLTLEKLRNGGAVLQEIILTPLTLEPLSQLIAETLHHNPDTVRPLAQVVSRKTEGNPFFVGEFLKMLYGENLLTFDAQQLNWQWNLTEIEAQNITDNVVELLLRQLQKLPEATQQILSIASCTGAEFNLETLAIVCEKSPKAIFQDLLAVIQAGLIQPLSELDEDLLVQEYKFLHDRVQQAAYALIDESQKQVVHLQIGRNLLEKTLPEQRSDRLFEIIDHLNQGLELITARSERTEIARLNLMAGQKAKAATAYEAAFKYFTTGFHILNSESWQSEYDLTLAMYSEAAEAAYLQGRFDEMEQLVEVVLNRAKTVVDKVQVYDSRIQRYLSQGNLKEALKIGLEVLKLLEVNLLETPSQLDVQKELESTTALLTGREIEDLINLPNMTAPEPLAAMHILANIIGAAYMVSSELMMLIACKMVNLSINYGNATWSPPSYAAYGFVLCGVVQDIELGYKFGQLALSLIERLDTKKGKAKALQIFSENVMQWKVHIRKLIPFLVDTYQNGVETGDFEFAGYALYNACYRSFFVGEELTQLEQKTATYSKASGQIRRENPSTWIAIVWQTILNLLDRSENPSRLVGRVCNEEEALPHALAVKDGTAIKMLYLHKVILHYLFEEYHQAIQTVILARQHFEEVTAITVLPVFCFYHSLALLSLSLDASNSEKSAWLSCVNTNQEKMQKWAEPAPMNYLHKFHLVEAEKARVSGQFFEAEEFYERAIAGAAENEYIQEEALAYELAAKHYLARGRSKIAQTYMKEAHYCYDRWGATAKVKDLEKRYPQFFSQSSRATSASIPITAETITNPLHTAFDLVAVMKASQAISREIELKQLLRSLMQTLIENAGAQTGYLILENSGEWSIEAACELNADENACATQVLQSIPIADQLPESIIQYVIRTLKPVTLNDETREGAFINEPYIQQNQPQSIFCLPLLNQAKLVGVLYLENRLASGVFTPERSQVLQLLSTQAAIAIENANLYSELQAKESKITQFLEAIPVGIAIVDATGCPYYANQCGSQLLGKETDPSVAPKQISEAYQLYVAGTDQIYPAESLPIVRALRGDRIRTEDIEIRRDQVTILLEAGGTPVFDQQGNITYAIATFQDITERKQAEKLLADYNCTLEQQVAERTAALRQSEANYRNLLQTANSVIIRYDPQGRIHYINDYGVKLLGYEEHEILGRTVFETIIPEVELSGRDMRPMVHDLLRNPQSYPKGEGENLCRDGRRVWMVWSNQAIFNEQGDVVEILSVGNDTTQRKQAEEALQRSEAKFRTIFENSQVGIYRTRTCDGLILDANQRFADLLGFDSPEEIVGLEHTTGFNVNPNDRQQFIEALKRDREVRSYEIQMQKRDGTAFWGLFSSYLNAADDYIEGVVEDISVLKQTEAALQTSEERLRLALTASNQGLYDLNIKTEEVVINPEYALMLGYDPATFHVTESRWIESLHPDDRESVLAVYLACITGEVPSYQAEYRHRTQDGQWKWILAVGNVVAWNESGEPIRALGVVTDIDDRKRAEAASILEERNRMAREIHDTLAQAFTGILAQVGAANQVLTDDLEATQAHLDLIKELARTGLTEARRSVVALRPQLLEEGSLQSALHRLVAQIRSAAMDTTLYYEVEGSVYSLPTEVESNLLRMGQEALTNAIKHANADEIRVELVYDRNRFCLRVKDNGQGFGVGSIPSSEGFGLLGMSERAERIGAQLTIRSQPGQGTEIIVTINRE